MQFSSWLRLSFPTWHSRLAAGTRSRAVRPNASRPYRPRLEALEARWCPTTYTATDLQTLGGPDSYAWAINNSSPPTIVGEALAPSADAPHATLAQNGQPVVDLNGLLPANS